MLKIKVDSEGGKTRQNIILLSLFTIIHAMINIEKQIEYWSTAAKEDLASAKILINKNRLLHGLFFCHLAIEKAIKAHVVKQTKEIALRSHNLILLSEIANLRFSKDDEQLVGILMKYQLQGRYPDYHPILPDNLSVKAYLTKTEILLSWLIEKL